MAKLNKKLLLASALSGAIALGASNASAVDAPEKCHIVDKDGMGLVKEGKADCASANNSCAGTNKAGDAAAWILLPAGACDKIEGGSVKK